MALTIEQLEERLTLYIVAEQTLMRGGQSYSIGNRSLTRADLHEIRKAIIDLSQEINTAKRGNQLTMHRIVPRDI